ncbi:RagB/SusD family nutrient uptake outer membrane protein [Spirosoma sp. KCTC 42546]|uniref:RagB/SusD family nutrient uptake outer membrane protein n=1 Tax=Spirosoma sp. KCTC 42546 TaxID=2520506 RepID=UPI001157AE02|nr:RagB/SusD family nutrient uptake outer membrane protein [Spirosoma sp. KCTC 42546]QDK77881.1 RagB/SusD family nutrient uptake outer membrane protein [Spirosoma sp. KCTC 42546]
MKKISYSTLAITLISLATGCTDVLNQVPVSALTQSSFFQNAADAEAAIITGYDALQGDEVRQIAWGDARADNLRVPVNEIGITDGGVLDFQNDNISTSSGYATWSRFYSGINKVNNVLAQVPAIKSPTITSVRDRIMGEAYFLRALNYFYLVRLWGAVPLVLEPTLSLDKDLQPARTPADKVQEQIIADLKQAEKLLPLTYASAIETRGRATQGAAQALLSKVYLWRSSYNQTNEWQLAADYAAKVIANPTYSLVSGANYSTIFRTKNTSESIFELQYNYNNQETNGLSPYFLPRSSKVTTGGNQTVIPTQKLVDAFEPGDVRKAASIYYSDPATDQFPNLPTVAKYLGTVVGTTRYSDSNFIFLRLADVILMQAEALAQLGQTAASIALVNRIRTRAGLANTTATSKDAVLLAIEQERFVELCFEGQRWYDLLRTGRAKAVLGVDKKALMPVYFTEIQLNPNLLPQNPGY